MHTSLYAALTPVPNFQLLDKEGFTMAWVYWIIGSLFYFYQFIFRTVFSTLGNEVAVGFDISVADLSLFFATGMFAYSLVQIPGGILLDRFGTRKILTLAMASLSAGIILVGKTESYSLAILGRVFMGIGSGFGFLGTSKIVVMWFPQPMMPFLLGITVFLGAMGGALSKNLFNALPAHWEWRHSLVGLGCVGAVLAVSMALILREKTAEEQGDFENKEPLSLGAQFKAIVTNKQILLAAFFTFFAYIPLSIVGDSWGPLAFEKMFNASKEVADQTITYFYVAFALGSLFYSTLAYLMKRNREILIFGCSAVLLFLYLLLFRTEVGSATLFGVPGFLVLSSLISFNIGGVALAFPIGCAHAPKAVSATVVGFINMLCMVSGSIFSKLIGNLLNFYWDGVTTADGLPLFSGVAYQSALKPILVTTLLAIVMLYFIEEGQPKKTAN